MPTFPTRRSSPSCITGWSLSCWASSHPIQPFSATARPIARSARAMRGRSRFIARAPSARLTIDGLLKEYPNDPYFHELKGQMLFENGHMAESVVSYRRAVQLAPSANIMKVDFARTLLEANKPENDQEAMRNLEIARQTESDSFELWRLMSVGYTRLNNNGMTSLARAEMSILRGERSAAHAHAAAAVRELQPGTPAWQRAQDNKAYIDSRPKKK